MARKNKAGKGGGAKKYGRMKAWCERYRLENRREKNKARKARKEAKKLEKKEAQRARRAARKAVD